MKKIVIKERKARLLTWAEIDQRWGMGCQPTKSTRTKTKGKVKR